MLSNGQLRTYQILVFLVSGTAGLVVSISLGWTTKITSGQCVLYSNMAIKRTTNGSIVIMMDASQWGTQTQCQFSTFCPVGLTIYCVIWMWFYIFLSDWGSTFIETKEEREAEDPNRPPPDQHLLIPSIVCNIVVFGLILTTVAMVEAGRSVWCENIKDLLREPHCDYVGNVTWLNLKGGSDIYGYLTHACVASWVLLISMVIQTVIIFVRLRRNSQRITSHNSLSGSSGSSDSMLDTAVDKPLARRRLQRQKCLVIQARLSSGSGTPRNEAEVKLLFDDEQDEEPVA